MYTILVVDDEFPIREWLIHTIQNHYPDYTIIGAKNGADALRYLENNEIHLIISDIRMPQLDGIGLFEQVENRFPDVGLIVLSSYDDYHYVRASFKHSAMDYLLKAEITEASLIAAIDHYFQKRQRKNFDSEASALLKKCIQNSSVTSDTLLTQLNELEISIPQHNYFLILFESQNPLIPNVSPAVPVFCVPIETGEYLGCISLNAIPSTLIQLQTQLTFVQELQALNSCRYILVSEIQYNSGSLLSACRLLYRYRSLEFYHKQLLFIKKCHDISSIAYFQFYLDIINAIKIKDIKQIDASLHAFFDYVEKNLFPDIQQLYISCIKILEELYLNFINITPECLADSNQKISTQIHHCNDISTLRKTVHAIAEELFFQSSATPKHCSSRIGKALRYIENNYQKPITLNEVASLVFLNPEYFSRHFKKETGTNFNNYINTLRLQQALDLVIHTDLKLSDVASSCGFQSFSYFSKRFRETFGCSPNTLRSSHAEETI